MFYCCNIEQINDDDDDDDDVIYTGRRVYDVCLISNVEVL